MDSVLTRKLFRDRYFQIHKPKKFNKGGITSKPKFQTGGFFTPQQEKAILGFTVAQELLEGTYGNHITPEVEPGTTEVSPSAALYEKFDEITAKEQERLGANRDIQATNRFILNSITGAPR